MTLEVIQDSTGGWTPSWGGTNIEWIDAEPTLAETADSVQIISCLWDGGKFRCSGTGESDPQVATIEDGHICLASATDVDCTVDTSSEIAGALTDETGTGALVFADTPTLVTPVIGAATGTSLALTGNLTGLVSTTLDTAASVALNAADCAGSLRVNNDDDAIDYTLPGLP